MKDIKFKLPGSSYSELTKIISAYGRVSQPASLEEITKLAKVHTTIVSRNNGFLLSVGLIEGGRLKGPTDLGKRLGNALEYEKQDEVQEIWKQITESNDFLSKMLAAIQIRKGMDVASLRGHIAYSLGLPKTSAVLTGAGSIIDILMMSGLVRDVDGQIVSVSQEPAFKETGTEKVEAQFGIPVEYNQVSILKQRGGKAIAPTSIIIEVRINATPNELDGLGPKVRQLVQELTESQDKENASE